jgi:hypothetical protein
MTKKIWRPCLLLAEITNVTLCWVSGTQVMDPALALLALDHVLTACLCAYGTEPIIHVISISFRFRMFNQTWVLICKTNPFFLDIFILFDLLISTDL